MQVVISDPSPWLRWLEVGGIWFTGIATLAVVFVAWSLRRFWERRQRPVLSVGHDATSSEDSRYIPPSFASGSPTVKEQSDAEREELWIRLCVNNTSKTTAKNVHLRLISAERERKGDPNNRSKWWFKASNLDQTEINIHPKLPEHFDIAYIRNIIGTNDDLSACLVIVPKDLRPWPQEKKRIEDDIENNPLEIGWTYTCRWRLSATTSTQNITN